MELLLDVIKSVCNFLMHQVAMVVPADNQVKENVSTAKDLAIGRETVLKKEETTAIDAEVMVVVIITEMTEAVTEAVTVTVVTEVATEVATEVMTEVTEVTDGVVMEEIMVTTMVMVALQEENEKTEQDLVLTQEALNLYLEDYTLGYSTHVDNILAF